MIINFLRMMYYGKTHDKKTRHWPKIYFGYIFFPFGISDFFRIFNFFCFFYLQCYFFFNLNKWTFIFALTVFQKRSHSLSTKIEVRGPQRAKPDQTSETHAQTYTHAFKKFFFLWVVPVCLIVCYLSMIKVRGFSIWKQGDNRRKHGGDYLFLFVWPTLFRKFRQFRIFTFLTICQNWHVD